jgi:hypothetical protein
VEFAPVERKTTRGVSHSSRVANVRPLAGKETRWVIVVPSLGGCAGKSRSGDDYPLYGCTLTDCGKFHRKSTNLGTLCGSGAEEGFANSTFLVGSANGLGLGKGEGPSAPLHTDYGACNCQGRGRGRESGYGARYQLNPYSWSWGCRHA